jgi:hypothetical protein
MAMSEHLTALMALDRKLTLVRLGLAIEALTPFVPEISSIPLPAGVLQRALEEWITTVERLITAGVYERYPEHARRHAHELARIVSNSASDGDVEFADIEKRVRRFLGGRSDDEDVLDLGDGLCLRKKRRDDGNRVEDWSALDALALLTDEEVHGLRSGHPYRLAICAYRLGCYEECRDALGRCLDEDVDVEEYWFLLAFTERHLGRRDVFERIVFGRAREWPR